MSFVAGADSGLAFLSAKSPDEAMSLLRNTGRYNGTPDTYKAIQIRDIGMATTIRSELLLESYVNALVAFDAIVSATTPYVGPIGPIGPRGKDAGFGIVTADVDETSGDPSVDVVMSGEDSEKNIDFHFHGIKGRQGTSISSIEQTHVATDDGGTNTITITLDNGQSYDVEVRNGKTGLEEALASVDGLPGTPRVVATFDSGVLSFAFYGLKGMQGEPGMNNTTMRIVDNLPTPSSQTTNDVYLMYNIQTEDYDRYITEYDGEVYEWVQAGSLTIDLGDYQKKTDDVWLTQAEWEALEIKDNTKTYNVYEEDEEI